jgi:alkanesulfonate monooxygenase SsuD/methylene tetrahydromethanopterin reductase-like flavin-dependent oxidoreductase (luciferase family)
MIEMRIGYFRSSEEWGPGELVEQARMAERAGFEGLSISDHARADSPPATPSSRQPAGLGRPA